MGFSPVLEGTVAQVLGFIMVLAGHQRLPGSGASPVDGAMVPGGYFDIAIHEAYGNMCLIISRLMYLHICVF